MKRILVIGLLAFFFAFPFVSCDKESEGLTHETLLCTLELKGGASVLTPLGEPYKEEGYTAFEDTVNVTDRVKVTGAVNTNKPGAYALTYSITNRDGIATVKKRNVVVSDKSVFEGSYLGASYFDMFPEDGTLEDSPITVTSLGYGFYEIDDILGGLINYGWYPGYAGYDFKPEATLRLLEDNTITLVEVGSWYYASYPITLTSGSFDPETGIVELLLVWRGYNVEVTLTK